MKHVALLLLIALPLYGSEEADEEEYLISEPCKGYSPIKRYYPYCSIFHDSVVRDPQENDDPISWPSRRDGTFMNQFEK